MTVKELLYQWWLLKEVTDRKGNPKRRSEMLYHEPVVCNDFQVEYYSRDVEVFSFDWYFIKRLDDGSTFIGCNGWHTSSIEEIIETENELKVITYNSIYVFEKINYSIFDLANEELN